MVVPDVTTDSRFDSAERAAWAAGGVHAAVTVALVKAGRFVGEFGVHSATPREWTAEEVALVEATAERTWAAVERARAEAALRESEAKYRTLFESIDEGFCLIEMIEDEAGRTVDARFLEVNRAFERQLGMENPTGKLITEAAPHTTSYWRDSYGEVARTGTPLRLERYLPHTGRWYHVQASRVGGPDSRQVAIVFDDITERKQQEGRREFLLALSDALRPLADPREIQATATRMLRERLDAGWCYYVEWNEQGAFGEVLQDATREGLPSLAGRHDVTDVPEFLNILQ